MPLSYLPELCRGLAVPVSLGIAGSIVRVTRFGMRSWRHFINSIIVSCFVAVLVHWGLDIASFPPTVDAAIIGFSSYISGNLLDVFQAKAIETVVAIHVPGTDISEPHDVTSKKDVNPDSF